MNMTAFSDWPTQQFDGTVVNSGGCTLPLCIGMHMGAEQNQVLISVLFSKIRKIARVHKGIF
jgi:hypothetical protein